MRHEACFLADGGRGAEGWFVACGWGRGVGWCGEEGSGEGAHGDEAEGIVFLGYWGRGWGGEGGGEGELAASAEDREEDGEGGGEVVVQGVVNSKSGCCFEEVGRGVLCMSVDDACFRVDSVVDANWEGARSDVEAPIVHVLCAGREAFEVKPVCVCEGSFKTLACAEAVS